MVYRSNSVKKTQKIAANLASKVLKSEYRTHAVVIALEGELGAGKTTFVKGFARTLGIKSHIASPTFVLLRSYQLPATSNQQLVHIDAYRLKNYRNLIPLGIKEIMADPKNIVLIEWSDRVRPILSKEYIKVHIDHIDVNKRKISIKTQSSNYKF